ncbi:glycoside hydrolase family 95 protein [Gelatoporia subvermispora B]|uniref:Glycoside hydrolase family 95 protein n=1 Tax=Ceriporiopsis subvermispora (strain B) TaxID=914234 RepID=M2RBL9_CERS8|nr:glycoside hydrolase family 95 protein [Gelatoporia subvermispora B]
MMFTRRRSRIRRRSTTVMWDRGHMEGAELGRELSLLTRVCVWGLAALALYTCVDSWDAVALVYNMLYGRVARLAFLAFSTSRVISAPPSFPTSGNGLWYTSTGDFDSWSTEWLPIGNGYIAATLPGGTAQETTQLNIESLWSGGPFQDPTYNGGNMLPSQQGTMAQDMHTIRQAIFQSPNGTIDNVEELCTDPGAYGSYAAAGYLLSTMNVTGTVSNYFRWLDLDEAVAHTMWTQDTTTFHRESFCSHPAQTCFEHINASSSALPALTYAFSAVAEAGLPTPNVTCFDNATLSLVGFVATPGMEYEILARVRTSGNAQVTCTTVPVPGGLTLNATLTVTGASEAWISWVGGTEYDMDSGDEAHGFTFRGPSPHNELLGLLTSATATSTEYSAVLDAHVADYQALITPFELSLGQTPDLSTPTDQLKAAYETNVGNTYFEWLLFNFGRYMLSGSARGTLPANLQGKWVQSQSNPWGADYHSNINIQMNYWFAEMTNMDVVTPLFDYIEKTWAPRGAETAQILYNISQGWVTHDEMNIFGHTGMKLEGNSAQWADYPESAVWMMIHVWDHFDYTNDVSWFKSQGWPLLKGVAQFHLQKLIPDERFNDSTLVVNPCNSPEQVPITLGCAHSQQLIWQLFNAIEKGFEASGDTDRDFLNEVTSVRAQMDKGIHIGYWGQLQEWKVDMDSPTDTHRHLSHLIGLYPGYAVTNFDPSIQGYVKHNYTRQEVLNAAEISLFHRGNGTGPDADAGWEKVWRAACWAQLANSSEFYTELSYAIDRNYASNLFSLYPPLGPDAIFQIDANLGYPAALLNALIQAPDVASVSTPLTITVLPALPADKWPSGSIKGARIRGGMTLDLEWENGEPTSLTIRTDQNVQARPVQIVHRGETVASFSSSNSMTKSVGF